MRVRFGGEVVDFDHAITVAVECKFDVVLLMVLVDGVGCNN